MTQPTSRTQYNEAFRRLLDTLNPAQLQAVGHIEGPVLVLAGPGTGKTHVLTARIGKILLETDTRPQNILCLTFTDAGVSAMRERLLEMIGPDAYRVPIHTFHSFCNRVIQENMEYFGKGRLEPVTELEQIDLVRQLLAKLAPEHPLRAGKKDAFQFEHHLRDLFTIMKKEGWTPGLVLRSVNAFLEELPNDPKFIYQRNTRDARKGEPKQAQIDAMHERMERLKAAADLYPKYQRALERAGRYEYEDMILWVLNAFKKHEALLRQYQERYLYIQVDEFQDTNGAQYQLFRLLLRYWKVPNAFIVGDDDQSIFEFQGARLDNLRHFYQQYQTDLELIVLEDNYRSGQPILDTAGQVIAQNQIRAVSQLDAPVQKQLRAKQPYQETPQVLAFETRLHELTGLTRQIQTLINQGVHPGEIAVIYARHKQAARLMTLLGKNGVPYQAKRPVNILDLPVIQQVRELLCYLDEEARQPYSGEHRLFRLLHADFFGLDPGDLARLAVAARLPELDKPADLRLLYDTPDARHKQAPGFWRQVLTSEGFLDQLPLKAPAAFAPISKNLDKWIGAVYNLPLPQLLECLHTQTGLLRWALDQPDKFSVLQILQTFFDFVEREVERYPRLYAPQPGSPETGLSRLIQLLQSMDDNRLSLPLQQHIQTGPGVQLLTAHAAKGLEFSHVFLLDCIEDYWDKSAGGGRSRFVLPPTLVPAAEEDLLEARRRLFYVAMTRARRQLHLSFAQTGENGKALIQSRFVEETGLVPEQQQVPRELLLETQAQLLLEADPPAVYLPEPVAFEELLHNFALSVTALNRYLRCPLAFYYEDFLKIPGTMSEAAAYGIVMHAALQQFVLKMKAAPDRQFPSAEALIRLFDTEMNRQRGHFSKNNFAQRLALGRANLRRIHIEQIPYWRKRAIVERRFDRVELEGIPLSGVIDKIEWLHDQTIRLTDYKTGTPDSRKTAPPDDRQPLGGDYWRQMAFYKILLDRARIYPEPVSKTVIAWLEPDRRGTFPMEEITFTTAQIQFVESLIRDTWQQIRAGKFSPGCEREDCVWCRMHRWKEMPETGFDRAEEGLDDGLR
ncbi:MAG: ATP-dependent helicase [Bacteroidetes bacterium]|nr:MAG: ATP-dependent helicase [Bacteroidota bacterium]